MTKDIPKAARLDYSGIWLSTYEFYSSGRNETYARRHHVVLRQTGDRVVGRSVSPNTLDGSSTMSLDLTVDQNVITGTWRERTGAEGYYRGATYHGALQLLADPTGRRLAGKWVGFGKNQDVNSGPWSLEFLDASIAPGTVERYAAPPAA